MATVSFNIRNTLTDKIYPISAPIGSRIDTTGGTSVGWRDDYGVTYKNEGTEEDPIWVVDDRLDYGYRKGYGEYFVYSEADLNENYIELEVSDELKNPDNGSENQYVICEVLNTGFKMHLSLWTETVVEQGSAVTKLHTSFTEAFNSGWFKWNVAYPPGQNINTKFSAMSHVWEQTLYIPDGKKPKISFHVEKARHGNYSYNTLVVTGWAGKVETVGGNQVVSYGTIWQRAVSIPFVFGNEEVIPGKTQSTTPNTTPNGGKGSRNNYSYDVPMPSVSDLSNLSYFVTGDNCGFHLYKLDDSNFNFAMKAIIDPDLLNRLANSIVGSPFTDYVLSCTKLSIPVNIIGEPTTASDTVYIGPFVAAIGMEHAIGKGLTTRYAESDTYTFVIRPYSGTYLDFDPNTKIEVHVPFCGIVNISPDDCMGNVIDGTNGEGRIEVKYIVDLITGTCCAIIRTTDQFGNSKISSVVSGQCGVSVPFVSSQYSFEKIAGAVSGIVSGAATGNPIGVVSGLGAAAGANTNKVSGISTSGGVAAVLGDRSLYVVIKHPQDMTGLDNTVPNNQIDNYGNKVGYPAAYFGTLSAMQTDGYVAGQESVYCECIANTNNIHSATSAEKESIRSILEGGVYI